MNLGAVKGDDQFSRFEGFEKLEVAHRQDGSGLAEVDDGFSKSPALANHLGGQTSLAAQVLGSFEVEPTNFEGEFRVGDFSSIGCPNFYDPTKFRRRSSHFFGERSDPSLRGSKLMGEYEDR